MTLLLAACAGCLLGAAYVGWIWTDARRIVGEPRRAGGIPRRHRNLMTRSAAFRLVGIGAALFVISRTGSQSLLVALGGMMLVRTVLVWRIGRPTHA